MRLLGARDDKFDCARDDKFDCARDENTKEMKHLLLRIVRLVAVISEHCHSERNACPELVEGKCSRGITITRNTYFDLVEKSLTYK